MLYVLANRWTRGWTAVIHFPSKVVTGSRWSPLVEAGKAMVRV